MFGILRVSALVVFGMPGQHLEDWEDTGWNLEPPDPMQRNWSHPTEGERRMDQSRAFQYRRVYDDPRSFYKPVSREEGMEQMLEHLLEVQGRTLNDLSRKIDDLYINLDGRINSLKLDVARILARVERLEVFEESRWTRRHQESARVIQAQKYRGRIIEEETSEENSSELSSEGTVGRPIQIVDRQFPGSTVDRQIQFTVDQPWTNDTVDRLKDAVDRLEYRLRHGVEKPASNAAVDPSFIPLRDDKKEVKCPLMTNPPKKKKRSDSHKLQTIFPWVVMDKEYLEDQFDRDSCKLTDLEFEGHVEFNTEELMDQMPFVEGLRLEEQLRSLVRRVMEKELSANVAISKFAVMCDREIAYRMPEKMKDPGNFELDVIIGNVKFENCLCDLGASVNVMPHYALDDLQLTNLKPCDMYVKLADNSERIPIGKFKNLPVMIGGDRFVPADFYVLEMSADEFGESGLILGRTFLKTAGALIDCTKDTITLTGLGTPHLTFPIRRTRQHVRKPDKYYRAAVVTGRRRKNEEHDDPDFSVSKYYMRIGGYADGRPTDIHVGRHSPDRPTEEEADRQNTSRPTDATVGRPKSRGRLIRTMPSSDVRAHGVQSTNIWVRPENVEYRIPYGGKVQVTREQFEVDLEGFIKEILEIWPFVRQCGLEMSIRRQASDLMQGRITTDDFCKHVSRICDEVIAKSAPLKMNDPGPPTLSCMIGYTWFEGILCDTGGSVNLMALSVANKLGFKELLNKQLSLKMADGTYRMTEGLLENVPMRAMGQFFLVDFHVMRYEDDPAYLMILGRPFLRTAGAIIDCRSKDVMLSETAALSSKRSPGFEHVLPRGAFEPSQRNPRLRNSRKPRITVRSMTEGVKVKQEIVDLTEDDDDPMEEQDDVFSSRRPQG